MCMARVRELTRVNWDAIANRAWRRGLDIMADDEDEEGFAPDAPSESDGAEPAKVPADKPSEPSDQVSTSAEQKSTPRKATSPASH